MYPLNFIWLMLHGFSYLIMVLLINLVLQNSFTRLDAASAATVHLYADPIEANLQMSQTTSDRIPPAVIDAVRQDLSRRTNIPPDEFNVVKATPQTWPDGCLGLAKPDELCIQMLVEGWRVIISADNQTWVYRTDSQGRTLRWENM